VGYSVAIVSRVSQDGILVDSEFLLFAIVTSVMIVVAAVVVVVVVAYF